MQEIKAKNIKDNLQEGLSGFVANMFVYSILPMGSIILSFHPEGIDGGERFVPIFSFFFITIITSHLNNMEYAPECLMVKY